MVVIPPLAKTKRPRTPFGFPLYAAGRSSFARHPPSGERSSSNGPLKRWARWATGTFAGERSFSSRSYQGHPAMKIGVFDWWREYFGRPEDQPLILALVLVLIAITLYVFL